MRSDIVVVDAKAVDLFRKEFAKRLSIALDGRTQTSVGNRTGCSRAVMSAYLAGRVPQSFHMLSKLSAEYRINLHWLLTGSDVSASEARAAKRSQNI